MGSSIRKSLAGLVAGLSALTGMVAARAQSPVVRTPGGYATVSGRVETPGQSKQIPVPGVMVTVHRVGSDSSGALDSIRTDANGQYSLRYAKFGDAGAVYFASATYRGVAYFSAPLRSARAVGEEAEITVFDTTSKPVEFHVPGRHIVVSSPHPDGNRDVVEVWELSNDTSVTVVGRDSLTPVWRHRVPAGALNFTAGPGDVSSSALVLRGDTAVLLAAFGPGVKQISYTYALPPSSFPLKIPVTQPTSVLEVLVEEAGGQVSGATLGSQTAANAQGRMFKRWLAQDVGVGQVIEVTVPTTNAALRSRLLIALASAMVLIMTGVLVRSLRRARPQPAPPVVIVSPRDALLASIASLDARRERGDTTLSAEDYHAERAKLKTELAALLAREAGTL